MQNGKPPPRVELLNLLIGHWKAHALFVAVELGIADVLAAGPQSCDDIAREVGADAGALFRLLRALASIDVFAQRRDGRFELTRAADLLRRDAPESLRPMALAMAGPAVAGWHAGRVAMGTDSGGPRDFVVLL